MPYLSLTFGCCASVQVHKDEKGQNFGTYLSLHNEIVLEDIIGLTTWNPVTVDRSQVSAVQ